MSYLSHHLIYVVLLFEHTVLQYSVYYNIPQRDNK